MINEAAVKYFLSLAKTLNFTETARRMYVTQQSVSKYIAKLEEDLGYKLFIRTHHYVLLTKAGEAYFKLFSEFESKFISATNELELDYGKLHNSLRVGHVEWLEISSGLSSALKIIHEKNPKLHITIEKYSQFELNELFFDRKLDLIITYAELAPEGIGIHQLKVLDSPLALLVSPDNPKVREGAAVADFRNEPFIKAAASHETPSESRKRALRQSRELDFTPSEVIISPNLESAYVAAEFGQGVLVSTLLSRASMHSELACFPIGKTEQLLCLWHEEQENPLVAEFANCLQVEEK